MIKEVISILGDIASGKIKDERMALLAEQLRDTDRKLVDATAEISALQSKVSIRNNEQAASHNGA